MTTEIDFVFDLSDYGVIVAELFRMDGEPHRQGYHVVNKTTGVVEYESLTLPSSINACKELNTALKEVRNDPVITIADATQIPQSH